MAPEFHSTDISAKVMEYGDDHTPCSEECPTILQSSIHELGSWWRMEWWGSFSSGGSACDDYWYQWNIDDTVFCLVGLDEDVDRYHVAGRIRCIGMVLDRFDDGRPFSSQTSSIKR